MPFLADIRGHADDVLHVWLSAENGIAREVVCPPKTVAPAVATSSPPEEIQAIPACSEMRHEMRLMIGLLVVKP